MESPMFPIRKPSREEKVIPSTSVTSSEARRTMVVARHRRGVVSIFLLKVSASLLAENS